MKARAGIRVDVQPFKAGDLPAPLYFEDGGIGRCVFSDDGQLYLGPFGQWPPDRIAPENAGGSAQQRAKNHADDAGADGKGLGEKGVRFWDWGLGSLALAAFGATKASSPS
jgi:hypothetical protein